MLHSQTAPSWYTPNNKPKNVLVFDIEIVRPPKPKDPEKVKDDIKYSKGWDDFKGMGIACIATYSYLTDDYKVFLCEMPDGKDIFKPISFLMGVENYNHFVTFNGNNFDIPLLEAVYGLNVRNIGFSFDILANAWTALGLGTKREDYRTESHAGTGLHNFADINLGLGKTGTGDVAAELWQLGEITPVLNYCMHDVKLTKMLFDKMWSNGGFLLNPKNPKEVLHIGNLHPTW